ncbi:Laccase domain protein [compost metagenome]
MMEPFIWNSIDQSLQKFELGSFQRLLSEVSAGFTGRNGGASKPPYSSLNLAYHVGDDPSDVLENRKRLMDSLGFEHGSWTCGEQVHGHHVAVVRDEHKGKGYYDRESAFQNTDALVTNVPGILLTSFYADCVPLYFLDPVNKAVGLAHAGWKGTVQAIAEEVVAVMEREYGSKRTEIYGAIGPSIGACCYEVDEFVMEKARAVIRGISGEVATSNIDSPSQHNEKTMLNLKELNRIIMIKAGILPTHIECTSWCTSCHSDYFYSYRKEGGVTGRMASWIGLKER